VTFLATHSRTTSATTISPAATSFLLIAFPPHTLAPSRVERGSYWLGIGISHTSYWKAIGKTGGVYPARFEP
jgi:hypothetical protein